MKGEHLEFKDSFTRRMVTVRLAIRYFMVNLEGQLEGLGYVFEKLSRIS